MKSFVSLSFAGCAVLLLAGCASMETSTAPEPECKFAPATTRSAVDTGKRAKPSEMEQRVATLDFASLDARNGFRFTQGGRLDNTLNEALRDCQRARTTSPPG